MKHWISLLILQLFTASSAMANVVGADTQNFNPTNDGLDFVTVHSSKTLTPGLFNVGVFLNYAVNSLPNYEDTTTQTRTRFRDSLLSSDVNFAVGILHNWEAGLSFPAVLSQKVDSDIDTVHAQFANTGLTEIRAMTKYRLWGDHDRGIAAVASANFNQIQSNPFQGTGAGPTYNLELAADNSFGLYQVGVNAGYRIRNPGRQFEDLPVEPFDDQYIASAAVSYLVTSWDTKIIGELFGSAPVDKPRFESDREASTLEALIGMKTDLTPSLAWHAGAGTEVMHGSASPDWRVYTGLNYVFGPVFSEPKEVIVKVQDKPLKALDEIEPVDAYSGPPEAIESFIARDVLFEFNSDQLKPAARATLQKLMDYLKKPPGFQSVTIEGHTDSIGKLSYNMDLSQRRANRVRQALISMGLTERKAKSVGYGPTRPIANNGNYQGRAMNRRVEFQIKR
jgi:outer membrane protein OmpA-like peptidoglycan-associated protein